ncbi:hypothetical protein [Pedobacter sp. JCM 36344]|uniref:hypothetical protein n=1 Tax=Pedobacter sp. JCM 36344 TaxID=3374280 RepID=UPI00397B856D
MRLFCLLIFFSGMMLKLSAQTGTVQGFVIDKDSKLRLAKVYIYNSKKDEGIYNTSKGEFRIMAAPGDTLFAVLQGYAVDTVVLKGPQAIFFQLKSLGINLREVAIAGKKLSPQEQYQQRLKEYKYKLDRGSSKDILSVGSAGAGLGIDAIYNLLSREGKNARHLQKILERDYKESIIDYRFRPKYVKTILQLKDAEILDFMEQYRPTYDFVLTASEYAFVVFLRNSYASYKRNPAAFRLQPLPKVIVKEF